MKYTLSLLALAIALTSTLSYAGPVGFKIVHPSFEGYLLRPQQLLQHDHSFKVNNELVATTHHDKYYFSAADLDPEKRSLIIKLTKLVGVEVQLELYNEAGVLYKEPRGIISAISLPTDATRKDFGNWTETHYKSVAADATIFLKNMARSAQTLENTWEEQFSVNQIKAIRVVGTLEKTDGQSFSGFSNLSYLITNSDYRHYFERHGMYWVAKIPFSDRKDDSNWRYMSTGRLTVEELYQIRHFMDLRNRVVGVKYRPKHSNHAMEVTGKVEALRVTAEQRLGNVFFRVFVRDSIITEIKPDENFLEIKSGKEFYSIRLTDILDYTVVRGKCEEYFLN